MTIQCDGELGAIGRVGDEIDQRQARRRRLKNEERIELVGLDQTGHRPCCNVAVLKTGE